MGLESASYISQLVSTNPVGGDPKSSADDHLRLIKNVLQTQFSGLGTTAVTTSAADLNKVGVTQAQTSNDTSVSSTAFVQTAVAAAISAIGAGAALWVSGTTYALGNLAWSPSNYQTYRRIIAGAGTTDPASDATNWVLVTGNVQTTATQTLTNKTLSAPVITGGASITGNVAVTGNITASGDSQLNGGLRVRGNIVANAANQMAFQNASGVGGIYVNGPAAGAGNRGSLEVWLQDSTGSSYANPATFSVNGLAVTGASNLINNAGSTITGNGAPGNYSFSDTGGLLKINWYNGIDLATVGGTVIASVRNTGLAVTGALSATSLTVGGNAITGSVQLGDDGGVTSIIASGTGGQVALGGVYGVSNGFVINVASDNSRTYSWTTGLNTQGMYLDNAGNFGLGVTPSASVKPALMIGSRASLWQQTGARVNLAYNVYESSANTPSYRTSDYASMYSQVNGVHEWYSAPNSSGAITWTGGGPLMTLDASGNFLAGTTAASNTHRLVKSNSSNYSVSLENSSASNGYVLQLASASSAGSAWNLIDGFANGTAIFRVSGNGNVSNLNNSYGAISDIKHKQDITDATPKLAKLLRVRIVNYKFKSDPDGIKQIGVIAQELEEISPGLIEEIPDFEEVEVEPARTETKVTQKQKMRLEESVRYETLLCDGQYRRLPIRTDIEVPLFEFHPLFDETGEPVLEVAEAAIEAQAEVLDEAGNVVTPAVAAKPAVMRQAMHQVPVMEDVTETIEVPAKTERRATGTTTKSVKYSIFVPMLIKAMQEQQAQIEELKARA